MRLAIFLLLAFAVYSSPALGQPIEIPRSHGDDASNQEGHPTDQPGDLHPGIPSSPLRAGAVPSGKNDTPAAVYAPAEALGAVASGAAVSLSSLLPEIEGQTGGKMIDAELIRVEGTLVYVVKVLGADGRVTKEYYDARSGLFIGSQQ